MRSTLNFNSHWQFTKPGAAPVAVPLPHTWNAADGTEVLFAIEGVGEQTAAVQGGKAVPPAMIQQLNAALNKIKKEG